MTAMTQTEELALSLDVTDFDTYQTLSRATAIYPNQDNNIYYPAMGLVGEAGEVINKVKKVMRDDADVLTDEKREQIAQEIGDVLWYSAQLATELGMNLSEIASHNLKHLYDRKARGVNTGSGDNR